MLPGVVVSGGCRMEEGSEWVLEREIGAGGFGLVRLFSNKVKMARPARSVLGKCYFVIEYFSVCYLWYTNRGMVCLVTGPLGLPTPYGIARSLQQLYLTPATFRLHLS